jgi:hypothetical protein
MNVVRPKQTNVIEHKRVCHDCDSNLKKKAVRDKCSQKKS